MGRARHRLRVCGHFVTGTCVLHGVAQVRSCKCTCLCVCIAVSPPHVGVYRHVDKLDEYLQGEGTVQARAFRVQPSHARLNLKHRFAQCCQQRRALRAGVGCHRERTGTRVCASEGACAIYDVAHLPLATANVA